MVSADLTVAWAARLEHFGVGVEFVYPTLTRSVSLSGEQCGLSCAHCNGHYLKQMINLEKAKATSLEKATSLLISGGCSPEGKVPFLHRFGELKDLAETRRLNFHVGLVNEEEAVMAGQLAEVVSFDLVGDNDTISEVYGLDATVEDYEHSYVTLRKHCRVAPHICVGLRGGRLSGERNALDIIERYGADVIVFLVLIPTRGTRYAHVSPPEPETVAELIAETRVRFAKTPLYLGCMRPGGRYRQRLDKLSLQAGVNKIVNPAPRAQELAHALGLEVSIGRECCVL